MEKNIRKIACNMIECNSCGELLHSKGRHDFVKCGCENKWVGVDGGNEYLRRIGSGYTEKSLYIGDSFLKIREYFSRYNSRIGEYVSLKNIPDDWLEGILQYYIPPGNIGEMPDDYLLLYLQEKQLRQIGTNLYK